MAAYFGKSVAMIERDPTPGGTVVSRGGIPTKTLREAATYLSGFHRRELYGVGLDLDTTVLLDLLRRRASQVVDVVAERVHTNLVRHDIEVIRGDARLSDDGAVEVELADGSTRRLSAERILVATGSRPFRPPGIPFDDPAVDDSDSILALDSIPGSLVVIGGGPVGVEYASISTALGVDVTLVDGGPRLIPFADEEISAELRRALESDGARFIFDAAGSTVTREDGELTVTLPSGERLAPDKVLFAAGRAGNTENLGLEAAGVETNERRNIIVDDHHRTSVPHIYAAGDVIGPPALASVSAEQGRMAVSHAFDLGVIDSLDSVPTFGVYSLPEVGMVGMTEQAARDAGMDPAVGRYEFINNPRARIAGDGQGFIKLIVDRADHRLLGVHIIGDEAAELVHIGQAALHAGDVVERFIHTTFNTPTRAEAYKYAAYDALQDLSGRRLGAE